MRGEGGPGAREAKGGPRVARRLLLWMIRGPEVEAIVGDIEEGYAAGGSRIWYWSQAVGSILSWWRRSLRADDGFQELRMAARRLRLRPGFSTVVVLTLALGIGANAAIFSVVNGVLLTPLPYPSAGRLFLLRTDLPGQGVVGAASSPPEIADIAQQARSFDLLGGVWYRPAALTDDATEPEDIDMAFVTAGLLPALGVEALLGRQPLPEEDLDGGERVIVLSEGLWRRRYGADPAIVGKRIEMDDEPHTVVGVMPASFRMYLPPDAGVPSDLDAWVPFGGSYHAYPRTWRIFSVVGRLRGDASPVDATAELTAVADRLRGEYGEYGDTGYELRIESLDRSVAAGARPMLVLLLGAVSLVMLIVCANIANLYLTRSNEAQREMMVRRALGATHARLVLSLAVECALITAVGAVGGVLLARWAIAALPMVAPAELTRIHEITLDLRVLAFVATIAATTAMAFAGVSAAQLRRGAGASTLRDGGRSPSTLRGTRLRNGLLVVELALSLTLLIGVGLLVRSFANINSVDKGFDTEGVVTIKLSLLDSHFPYAQPEKIAGFYRRLTEEVAVLPGVEAAGVSSYVPLVNRTSAPYAYETESGISDWGAASADYHHVTPGWLEAIGARLLAGRLFEWRDDLEHPGVVIIDDKLAATAWPDGDALGKRLRVEVFVRGEWTPTWAEVVGVVQHMKHEPAAEGIEQVFLPHAQSPMRTTVLTVRTGNDVAPLTSAVGGLARSIDGDQPVGVALPLASYVRESLAARRFALTLLSMFSALALLLALVGTYGVVSYAVSQRTREIGVQIAIGANPGRLVASLVVEGAKLALVGAALGVGGAVAMARLLSSLLYGVAPTDPLVLTSVAAATIVVTLAACYVPARKAAHIDPVVALRGGQ